MARWWIDEARVLGCGNPTVEDLKDLWNAGFRTVISLLNEREQKPKYDKEIAKQIGLVLNSVPITDFTRPSPQDFTRFLNLVDEGLSRGKVVVHCWGGSGRTGTMGAAYWIARGISAGDAIAKVRSANPHAVETSDQERSLYDLAHSFGVGGQR